MRLTLHTALVLQALVDGARFGFDVMDVTGLPSGTVYPILRRLDRDGLARSHWEAAQTAQHEQRPPRRYYELTRRGAEVADKARARYRAHPYVRPSFFPAR